MSGKKITEDQVFQDAERGHTADINLSQAVKKHLDMKKTTVTISLRMDSSLLQTLKDMAESEGLPYQSLIKILIRDAIKDHENKGILENRILKLEEKVDLITKKLAAA
jgi:predicted DNA binding CopG/RHH family protein